MIKKKELGQAFILVLIILAIGALVVVPTLRLTTTVLKSNEVITQRTTGLYACEAAQEYVMWKLLYNTDWRTEEFQDEDVPVDFTVDVCGTIVHASVVMRAVEGEGGTTLATEDKIMPTKEVTPSYVEERREELYTYTIILDYLSDINEDNPKVYLDAIYDIPPGGFGAGAYDEEYGSWLSLDGGETWLSIPHPDSSKLVSMGYLKWPADYDPDTGEGAFSSHPEFLGIEDFEVREVKKLRFKMRGTLADNNVHCNWVVLKMDNEEHPNTLSGPQAPIKVGGDPDIPGVCEDDQVLEVFKTSNPEIIQPGVATPIEYTISITNMYTRTHNIKEITDYLPPGFDYVEIISSELLNPSKECQILELDPLPPLGDPERYNPENDISELNIQGVTRLQLRWRTWKFPLEHDISIASGQTLKLTFRAMATKDVSGSYYNEVIVLLRDVGLGPLSSGLGAAGVVAAEFGSNYSWLTGAVMVPAYDSSTGAEGENITANMALEPDHIRIISWNVE